MSDWNKDTITINDREVTVAIGYVKVQDLYFYPENPRLYSILNVDGSVPSQDDIFDQLKRKDHVRQLLQSIKANGGLTDPLIVLKMNGKNTVIEGNTRLAAYRILKDRYDPIKWGKVKCKIIEDKIDNDDIFKLLGEYHIIGKKDWSPYEQAGYLYRRHKLQNIDKRQISTELGKSQREINHLIEVYELMLYYNENNPEKWSYFDEYLRRNDVKKARKENSSMDDLIVDKIRTGEINSAMDLRDKLPVILKAGKKIQKKFLNDEVSFDDSFESAQDAGADNAIYNKLKKFRTWTTDEDLIDRINSLEGTSRKRCNFEIDKIITNLNRIKKYMQ